MAKNSNDPVKGMVFDIQRYSIHDGPGIRTIVFLKGCPLQCKWCSNPESQGCKPQIFYVKSRCIRCGLCVANCRNGEVKMGADRIEIDYKACNHEDLDWVGVCPTGALCVKGRSMTVDEAFEAVMKDEVFYRESGGGLTLSGGEPLIQPEFALELLKKIHDAGISTAVETTGEVPLKILMDVLPYVDLFLYDFKHWNNEEHIKYTGISDTRIKSNLKALAEADANIMVRMPLIPGVNDSEESVKKVMDILKEYGIRKFVLLPFHQYGSGKYASAGMDYEMMDVKVSTEAYVKKLHELVSKEGFSGKY